jgi:hypothetical protein
MSQSDIRSFVLESPADADPGAPPRPPMKDAIDFSLVLGGPLYQLWRRTHMSGDLLELVPRRVIVLTLLAWAPLLVLSLAEGHVWGRAVQLPFLNDIELHARLLLALPLLIFGELFIHRRMRGLVQQFLTRGLIPDSARPTFEAAIASGMRLRNSLIAELLLIALVLIIGIGFVWPKQVALDVTHGVASWYGAPVAGRFQPSLAGWWLCYVSLPLFQFLLLRWYFRLFIWARFLWHVSRIDLQLEPLHPDRSGGLGFLGAASYAFAPILMAQGVVLGGMMSDRIFYAGAQLFDFKVDVVGLVIGMVFAILGPLLVFSPKLAAAKRAGKREYGMLAMRYVREFNRKWLCGETRPDEPLMGSADIQSLADLGNSFEVPQSMRIVPFGLNAVLQLGMITLAPVLPLLLTIFSPEEILDKVLNMLF